ncbi:MAG: hypothetical protein A2Y33_16365 [Spirochaetes bacterium GWF1_51_8]|nr:MAG: hypothetical protein A2Y33_16365 [Spirochaetes bacterium GWF1_51_8]
MKVLPLLLIVVMVSCSEFPSNGTPDNVPVAHGSILVLDEANGILRVLDPSTGRTADVATLDKSPTDIEIDGGFAYIVHNGFGTAQSLIRIDLNGVLPALKVVFPDGSAPSALKLAGGKIYIVFSGSNWLRVLDQSNPALTLTNIALAANYAYSLDLDSGYIYIADSGTFGSANGKLIALDRDDYSLAAQIASLTNPQSVCAVQGMAYLACTGVWNTTNWDTYAGYYDGGGLIGISAGLWNQAVLSNGLQFTAVKVSGGRLFCLDSGMGQSKLGLAVFSTNGAYITNVLGGKNFKGLDFDGAEIAVSEGYYGTKVYLVNISNWTASEFGIPGTGDLAIYH